MPRQNPASLSALRSYKKAESDLNEAKKVSKKKRKLNKDAESSLGSAVSRNRYAAENVEQIFARLVRFDYILVETVEDLNLVLNLSETRGFVVPVRISANAIRTDELCVFCLSNGLRIV